MIRNLKNKHGFTLVELIVVLLILGILASIAVPSFTGYIDKQKEKDAIAECRQVVAAAQNMYNDQLAKNNVTAVGDYVTLDNKYDEVAELAGVNGTVTGISPDTADITSDFNPYVDELTYIAENGLHVKYTADGNPTVEGNPKYELSDDSIYTPLEKYVKDYEQTIKEMIQNGDINKYYDQRSKYALDYLNYQKEHGGSDTFLQVEQSFLGEENKGESLYWQPYYINNGDNKNGVKGSTSTLLFATQYNGTEDSTKIHNRWYARLIYFKGHIYKSTAIESKVYQANIASLNNCNSDTDVEAWLADPAHKFEQVK